MITPELAVHIAEPPDFGNFDDWIWGFERFERDVMATAASAVAEIALTVWGSYDGPDARDWYRGNEVLEVVRRLRTWAESKSIGLPEDLAEVADQLARRVAQLGHQVDEASGSREICERRERILYAACSALAAARVVLWTPESVPSTEDFAEREARLASGPALQFAESCRLAAFAIGEPAAARTLALAIKSALVRRFEAGAG